LAIYRHARQRVCRLLSPFPAKGEALLTEQEVSRTWRKLFNGSNIAAETFDKAEQLLEELRPESPLRHRLNKELVELRRIKKVKEAV
jgi:hypothetical protein